MDINPEVISFKNIDLSDPEIMKRPCNRLRRTPIICTLTDPDITVVELQTLMESGMNVATLKTLTTTSADRLKLLRKLQMAADKCCKKFGVNNWPIASNINLKTIVTRTGVLENVSSIYLKEGHRIALTCDISFYDKCNERLVYVDNPHLNIDVKPGMEISISQDEIILNVLEVIVDESLKCIVTQAGNLSSCQIVCVRGMKSSRPYVSNRDLRNIQFALDNEMDIVTISYSRHPDTLKNIRKYIKTALKGKSVKPIMLSGICTHEGIDNIDEIIKISDGIVFQRNFLPYELESNQRFKLHQLQKWVGGKCRQAGKSLYLSGGVCDSILKGKLNVTEISDITNALMDGVSGFILGDCYDAQVLMNAINLINDVCCSVEPLSYSRDDFFSFITEKKAPLNAAEACALSCVLTANQTNSRLIVIPTVSGKTAKILVTMRPACLILTVSSNTRIVRILQTYQSVVAFKDNGTTYKNFQHKVEARVLFALEIAMKRGWVVYGDTYVVLQRDKEDSSYCDKVSIHNVYLQKQRMICPDN